MLAPSTPHYWGLTINRLMWSSTLLDDFAVGPLPDHGRRDLLEILEDRTGTRASIITSQLPPAKWHDYVADPTLADALCDRLLHPAHRVALKGPSRRKEASPSS